MILYQISVCDCRAQLAALTLAGLRVKFPLDKETTALIRFNRGQIMYVLVLLYNAVVKSVTKFHMNICNNNYYYNICIYYLSLKSSTRRLSVICTV